MEKYVRHGLKNLGSLRKLFATLVSHAGYMPGFQFSSISTRYEK